MTELTAAEIDRSFYDGLEKLADDWQKYPYPIKMFPLYVKLPKDKYTCPVTLDEQHKVFNHYRRCFKRETNSEGPNSDFADIVGEMEVRLIRAPERHSPNYENIAAGFFVMIPETTGGQPVFRMPFLWIHPFFRNKGLLKCILPEMRQEFGDFSIGEPSRQLQGIIEHLGLSDVHKFTQ